MAQVAQLVFDNVDKLGNKQMHRELRKEDKLRGYKAGVLTGHPYLLSI